MSTFYSDVVIDKAYPAVIYMPEAPDNGTYFEDREINGVMYRTQNATYNGTSWSQKAPSQYSYATTQNADGSISHYSVPPHSAPWTAWGGNGQWGTYNVRDFGAAGNGTGDDSVFINKANAAAVANGGGYIYLPAGTYQILNVITLGSTTDSNIPITIGGQGADLTKIVAAQGINGGTSLLMLANAQWSEATTSVVQMNIYIEKLTIDANARQNASGSLGPVYLKQVQNCGVLDCEIVNSSNNGILISGDENHVDWPTTGYINFQVLRNHVNLNNEISGGAVPIRIEGANTGIVQGNTIGDQNLFATSGAGIYCPGSCDLQVCDNYVTMCNDGIDANASTDVIISTNQIVGTAGFGVSTASSALGGTGGVTRLVITGNTITNPAATGILVAAPSSGNATDFTVSDNIVAFNTNSPGPYGIQIQASQGTVSGNIVDLAETDATAIAIDSSQGNGNAYVAVTGNTIGNGNYGIQFISSGGNKSQYCTIIDNNVFFVNSPGMPNNFTNMQYCVVRSNPGINPWMAPTSTPLFPNSGHTVSNTTPLDMWVTLTGNITSVAINGQTTGVTTGSILLPAGGSGGQYNRITVSYGQGGGAWTWLAM